MLIGGADRGNPSRRTRRRALFRFPALSRAPPSDHTDDISILIASDTRRALAPSPISNLGSSLGRAACVELDFRRGEPSEARILEAAK